MYTAALAIVCALVLSACSASGRVVGKTSREWVGRPATWCHWIDGQYLCEQVEIGPVTTYYLVLDSGALAPVSAEAYQTIEIGSFYDARK